MSPEGKAEAVILALTDECPMTTGYRFLQTESREHQWVEFPWGFKFCLYCDEKRKCHD